MKALSKRVVDRFTAAGDMAAELDEWLHGNSIAEPRHRDFHASEAIASASGEPIQIGRNRSEPRCFKTTTRW